MSSAAEVVHAFFWKSMIFEGLRFQDNDTIAIFVILGKLRCPKRTLGAP